jgi:hypothetical protein
MNVRTAVAIACGPTLLVATVARAQEDRWERHVRGQLERAAASLGPRGDVRSVATHAGMLNTDEADWFTLRLHAGISYVVVGTCDEDCTRLGLVLSDGTSHELAADRGSDHAPVVRVTPRETASYRVKAVMERCRMNPCRYGIAVITLPAP